MNSCWRIFSLEILAILRSGTFAILTALAAAWMLCAPRLLVADGTAEGARELALRYGLGGVTAFLAVALLAAAAGSVARERAAKRLQLTLVRPVPRFAVALGKIFAYALCGAAVLAVAVGIEALRQDLARPCRHVARPVLPSAREEARTMYAAYMADPSTPEAVRKAGKATVLRILENRARDHYQSIATNATAAWRFAPGTVPADARHVWARFKLANAWNQREDVKGRVAFGARTGAFARLTRSAFEVPLEATDAAAGCGEDTTLTFVNEGPSGVMVRPRQDVEILVAADGFGANLLRAYVELVALVTLLVAFGVFLSTCLGRPVAVFTALVMLLLSEMSPAVLERSPEDLTATRGEAIGYAITRFAAEVTHPVSALSPLAALADDACLEPRDVARVALASFILAPLAFALLAGFVMPRKSEGGPS